MYPGLEKELVDYIKKKKEEKLAVTTSMIRKKTKELGKTLDIRDAKFSLIRDFLEVLYEKTNIIEKQFIIFFDKTPMWFDMPRNLTIDFQ
ncbi:13468_t:CDS:2, partial [Dentiscutata erythropus]